MRPSACAALAAGVLAAMPAGASAVGLSPPRLVPAQYAVRGAPLLRSGKVVAGHSVSVFARPVAVTVDGCRSSHPRVRVGRRSTIVSAALACTGVAGQAHLTGVIRGGLLTGRVTTGRRVHAFRARRAKLAGSGLAGKPSSPALASIGDVKPVVRHGTGELSRSGAASVVRTQLVLVITPKARVQDVQAALNAVGGRIEAALAGSPVLVVSIPDPGTPAALGVLRKLVARMPGISSAGLSVMPALDDLPPEFATPPTNDQATDVQHLLAMRMPAAWNARAAIQMSQRPLLIIADDFGNGPLDSHVDATYNPIFLTSGSPNLHGYHVTGIAAANLADDGTPAGLVTGVFPATTRLEPLDISGLSMPDVLVLAATAAKLQSGHIVLNTSLGYPGLLGGSVDDATRDGANWANAVRQLGLESRMLQSATAGNSGRVLTAANNSPWTAAALRSDLSRSGTPVAPLHNTLVAENLLDAGAPGYGPGCPNSSSNSGGTVSAIGTSVYSNTLGATAGLDSGTSMAAPQAGALGEYLWSIAPDLSAPQVAGAILANAGAQQACQTSPPLDAYAATLSLDQATAPIPSSAPVRFAILNQDGQGAFDQADLQAFADHIFTSSAGGQRDWSRWDLNGDGFTGGGGAAPFDLDPSGSTRAGAPALTAVTQAIDGDSVPFDEHAVSDADILCYYAYSGLYGGAPDARSTILGTHCRPNTGDFTASLTSGACPSLASDFAACEYVEGDVTFGFSVTNTSAHTARVTVKLAPSYLDGVPSVCTTSETAPLTMPAGQTLQLSGTVNCHFTTPIGGTSGDMDPDLYVCLVGGGCGDDQDHGFVFGLHRPGA